MSSSRDKSSTKVNKKIVGKTIQVTVKRSEASNSSSKLVSSVASPTIDVHIGFGVGAESLVEKLPISMNTTAAEVINCLLEKHGKNLNPHQFEFYLKECTDSGTDVYIRVMDGDERVMQSLNRQQEGKYLFFTLYKQEKQSLVSGEGIHQEENADENGHPEIQFFSPPHIVEVKDRKHRRRNSLPSYVCFGNGSADQVITDEEERNMQTAEEPVLKPSSSIIGNKMKSLGDIMNQVIQETDQTRFSNSPLKEPSPSISPNESSTKIRSLVCSPYVSPEKMYPKFVFTPMVSTQQTECLDHYSTSPDRSKSPPPVFSLDTTKGTIGTSPVSDLSVGDEEMAIDEDTPTTKQNKKLCQPENEVLPGGEKMVDCEGEDISTSDKIIHTAVMRPTPTKKVAHHVRASSPLEEDNLVQIETGSVDELKHSFVRRERQTHSPCISPVHGRGMESTLDQENDQQSELLVMKETILQSDKNNSESFVEAMHFDKATSQEIENANKTKSFTSQMDLVDSFSSYLSSTFDDGNFSVLPPTSLVSPDRTKTLIDEATAHARRRRPSAGNKTLSSKAISESGLKFHLSRQPQTMKHHTSSPLISPARYDMLIQQASEHIRAKRRSALLVTEGEKTDHNIERTTLPDDDRQPQNNGGDNSGRAPQSKLNQSMIVASSSSFDRCVQDCELSGSFQRNNSERFQRKRFPIVFQWRSLKGGHQGKHKSN